MDRIRTLRRESKISQRDLGAMLGRTRNSVSQWELDKQIPGVVDIGEMCRIFRVSSDYLLGLSDDRREPAWIRKRNDEPTHANLIRLRQLRLERQITQQELAADIGRACSTISVWEREKQTPGVRDIGELCRILGVTSDYLLGLSDSRELDCESETFLHHDGITAAAHMPVDVDYSMLNAEGQELMTRFFEVALRLFPASQDSDDGDSPNTAEDHTEGITDLDFLLSGPEGSM